MLTFNPDIDQNYKLQLFVDALKKIVWCSIIDADCDIKIICKSKSDNYNCVTTSCAAFFRSSRIFVVIDQALWVDKQCHQQQTETDNFEKKLMIRAAAL